MQEKTASGVDFPAILTFKIEIKKKNYLHMYIYFDVDTLHCLENNL